MSTSLTHLQQFSQEDFIEAVDCFIWFDDDEDFLVDVKHLPHMLRCLQQWYNWTEIVALHQELKEEGLTQIGPSKFIEIVSRRFCEVPNGNQLTRLFRVLDKDRKKRVNIEFIRHACASIGDKVKREDFDHLLAKSGVSSKAESLKFSEFTRLCLGEREIRYPSSRRKAGGWPDTVPAAVMRRAPKISETAEVQEPDA